MTAKSFFEFVPFSDSDWANYLGAEGDAKILKLPTDHSLYQSFKEFADNATFPEVRGTDWRLDIILDDNGVGYCFGDENGNVVHCTEDADDRATADTISIGLLMSLDCGHPMNAKDLGKLLVN
ncbi:hypothetical protein NVP1031O_122 [Vibrio phage 1.031.O._10N.261.46.F8]|nr:hypothetical protein NVP1031O_122 [Vibrio phage 1.031.O._10N.261.46.F8]